VGARAVGRRVDACLSIMKTSTPHPEEYDLVILGTGEGSKFLAWTFARKGQRVAIVDRKYIGGSCPNIACLPSKNIVHSAKVASYFRRGAEFGIATGDWKVDMAAVRDRSWEGSLAQLAAGYRTALLRSGGRQLMIPYREMFGAVPPGELVVHADGAGMVSIAVNGGDAAQRLGLPPGARVSISPSWQTIRG